jgi:hypothetical protein
VSNRPKCPICRAEMVPMPDLFGEKRYRHPESECVAPRLVAAGRPLTVRVDCIQCGETFTSPLYYKQFRKTCSEDCWRDFSSQQALRATEARLKKQRKAKNQRKKQLVNSRIRAHWQKKWEEQNQRRMVRAA